MSFYEDQLGTLVSRTVWVEPMDPNDCPIRPPIPLSPDLDGWQHHDDVLTKEQLGYLQWERQEKAKERRNRAYERLHRWREKARARAEALAPPILGEDFATVPRGCDCYECSRRRAIAEMAL